MFALVIVLSGIAQLESWLVLTPDSFRYLRGARSLSESGTFGYGRLLLPPGFSCLLQCVMTPDGLPLLATRMLLVAGWILTAILTYIYYKHHGQPRIIAFLIALSPALLIQSEYLLSELVFMPLVIGALIQFESWRQDQLSWWRALLGIACAAAAILTRSMGVVLIPIGLLALARRQTETQSIDRGEISSGLDHQPSAKSVQALNAAKRVLIGIGLVIATVYPSLQWSARERSYPGEYGYSRIFLSPRADEDPNAGFVGLQASRFIKYAPIRLASIMEALVPTRLGWRLFQPPLAMPTTWIIGGGLVLLLIWRAWRYRLLIDYFALSTLALLAIWPWDEGVRFVLPLLPALWAAVIQTLAQLSKKLATHKPQVARAALVGFVLLCVVVVGVENSIIIGGRAARAEKARSRLTEMQTLASMSAAHLNDATRIGCVLENESRYKTTIIGAAYLQRRWLWPVVDVKNGQAVEWSLFDGATVFVSPAVLQHDPAAPFIEIDRFLDDELRLIAVSKSDAS